MKKLILFDLDGVLLDSRVNMAHSWNEVCQKTGLTIPFDDYFALIGRPFRDILSCLGVHENQVTIEQVYMSSSLYFLSEATFFPGTREALEALLAAGCRLGIVTSKDAVRTQAVLTQLGIGFASVQSPSAKMRGKPAPDHLLLAMAECGVDPADTVYVGDMETDHEAAVRAGIDYIHASWGYGAAPSAVASLPSIDQLPAHLLS